MFPEEVAFDAPPNCFLVIAIASDGLAEEHFPLYIVKHWQQFICKGACA